jgi:hypothetical protein
MPGGPGACRRTWRRFGAARAGSGCDQLSPLAIHAHLPHLRVGGGGFSSGGESPKRSRMPRRRMDVDYAMLVKLYGAPEEPERTYSLHASTALHWPSP